MAYTPINDWTARLAVASRVRVTLTYSAVPFSAPGEADILIRLNGSSLWTATAATTREWLSVKETPQIEGVIKAECTGSELIADIVNRINTWNVFNVQAALLETDIGWRPSDVIPSTNTTVALVAIAAVVVVGFVLLRQGGLVR